MYQCEANSAILLNKVKQIFGKILVTKVFGQKQGYEELFVYSIYQIIHP